MRAAAKPMTILMALPEAHLEMEAEDLTSDALLGARVAKRESRMRLHQKTKNLQVPMMAPKMPFLSPPSSAVEPVPTASVLIKTKSRQSNTVI